MHKNLCDTKIYIFIYIAIVFEKKAIAISHSHPPSFKNARYKKRSTDVDAPFFIFILHLQLCSFPFGEIECGFITLSPPSFHSRCRCPDV